MTWTEPYVRDMKFIETTDGPVHITPGKGAKKIPVYDGATKAYNPDQPRDADGRWGSGGGISSHKLGEEIAASPEGGTIDPYTGEHPHHGVQVGGIAEPLTLDANVHDIEAVGRAVKEYAEANHDKLGGNVYVGWWADSRGNLVVEPSENVADRAEGVRLGQQRNQEAVWDLDTMTEVPTGGTGQYTGTS